MRLGGYSDLFRKLRDSFWTIPGQDVVFFPNSNPREAQGRSMGSKLNFGSVTWIPLLGCHALGVLG